MKNVYLLPTDKPSRLFKDNSQALNLHTHPVMKGMFTNGIGSNQHLYITSSDEEIKLSNWACHKGITNDKYQLVKCTISNKESIQEHWSKIILTTDQDLIADGVQAIDEELLEWFVKNPSCEDVEVIPLRKSSGWYDNKEVWHWDFLAYKIIVPNSIEEYELQGLEKYSYELLPKQETTIEEAAEKLGKDAYKKHSVKDDKLSLDEQIQRSGGFIVGFKEGILEGAKWQQEQNNTKYTEEEVIEYTIYVLLNGLITPKMWFEQFKKK